MLGRTLKMTFDDPDIYYFMDIIKEIRSTDRIDRKMSDTIILINALGKDAFNKSKGKELMEYLDSLMKNSSFRRKINIRNKMMTDTEESLMYLGEDYKTDSPHIYDDALEDQIREIEDRIRGFLSIIIRELVSDEIKL